MSYKRITLGGTTFYPSSIDVEEQRVADTERMADGTLRVWHRAFKNKWILNWTKLTEDSLSAIRSKYRVTTSQTYNDETNTNYTVVTTEFTTKLSADVISLAGKIYYDVSLTCEEV